ncbi:MAG: response regulator, partial [Proteobacteria bacterium]|nr:response regulator [Pseudomonadota bacterium]
MPIIALNNQPLMRDTTGAAHRVLIVDDQLVVRGAVRTALEKMDRDLLVIEADTGEEALSILRNSHVDMIFCDIQLPGMTGPEALVQAFGDKAMR